MLERDMIHAYLKSLSKYLSRLSKPEADEVTREIEAHIYDAIELQQESGGPINIEEVLVRLGSPRELAAQYSEHILEGAPPPRGFKSIQKIKKGATQGLMASMALMGFSFSLLFAVLGLAKFIYPEKVGVWSVAHGNSIIIAFSDSFYPNSTELLEWWLIPITWSLAAVTFQITRKVLAVMKVSMILSK